MSILITGSTGFVGQHLVQALIKKGQRPTVLVRSLKKAKALFFNDVDYVECDLKSQNVNQKALPKHCTTFIHVAGLLFTKNKSEFYRIHEDALKWLCSILPIDSKTKIIAISSIAARGPNANQIESTSLGPISDYGKSKANGDDFLQTYSKTQNIDIIRPPIIFGENDESFMPILKLMKSGFLPIIKNDKNKMSFLYVQDLVATILERMAIQNDKAKLLYCDDGQGGYSWQDIANIGTKVFNTTIYTPVLPLWILKLICQLENVKSFIFKSKPQLTKDKVKEASYPFWFCHKNYKHKFTTTSFEQALKKMSQSL